MDYVAGTKITSLSPVVRLDVDGDVLAEQLFQDYLKQVLVDGFFHADPHPGNVFLTERWAAGVAGFGHGWPCDAQHAGASVAPPARHQRWQRG